MTDSQTFHDTFTDLECDHSLFDIRADGVPIWERIRFPVYRAIQTECLDLGTAQDSIEFNVGNYLRGLNLWLRNSISHNPYLAGEHDIFVWGHPRRKQLTGGQWWDIYCDPIYEACDLNVAHFEPAHQNRHLQPARTEDIRYLDLIEYTGTFLRKTGLVAYTLPERVEEAFHRVEASFSNRLGVEINLVSRAEYALSKRRSTKWLYERLIDRVDPRLAVVVVSYGKETFIEVCKENQIPVAELQHGVIYPQHTAYAYRGNRTKEMFPDYLLTFGDYWNDSVEFPIPDHRLISVGYPYLEQSVDKYDSIEPTPQLVFISQGVIGKYLSKFAMECNQHPGIEYDIVYKLHPGEYGRWRDAYPWLRNADFEIIDSADKSLYQLFAESRAQIGVGSTAMYEGLAFGLETFVYDCPGPKVLQPLIDEGPATMVSSADGLASSLGTREGSFEREHYFKPNAATRICDELKSLKRTNIYHGSS